MKHHLFRTLAAGFVAVVLARGSMGAAGDILLRAADAPVIHGTWAVITDASAAGGTRLGNPDQGVPKPASPLASPSSYVELTFEAAAGTPYHLWIRGRAQSDSYENDSVYVQFSDSVTPAGAPVWRIGSTSGTSVVLEDCPGCGVAGWGWQDNHYGGQANPITFAGSGSHTIRIQVREDGLSIDQIVLSPGTYLNTPPGAATHDTTILTGGSTAPEPSVAPIRGPYLQQVQDRSATLVWASREPGPAHAVVGSRTFPALTTFLDSASTGVTDQYQHEAAVTDLFPSTRYAYRLFVGGVAATPGNDQFVTAPAPGSGRVRFIAFGDSGTGSPEQAALASRMGADTFDLALHAGDVAYGDPGGTGDASHATYQSWFFDVYRQWLRRTPFFPSMGNHDSRPSTDWGRAYLELFALARNGATSAFPDHAERYYSFDYGPIHFVALDTEFAFEDPARRATQLAWLDDDLGRASAQPWKVAFFHRSPFSAPGEHGSELGVRQAFAPIFERHGVQLSVSAHEHTYQRSVPWRTGGDASTGQAVTYLVTGGGGGPLFSAGRDEWTAASASEHHYLRVTVDGCTATIEAVRISGAVMDRHVLDRCAQATDGGPPVVNFSELSPGMTVAGVTAVTADASDDVRVEKVDLWIDGRLHSVDVTPPYAFSWDTTAAGAGTHTVELRAYDIAGHRDVAAITLNVAPGGGGDTLPEGWVSQDIGPAGLQGSASFSSGLFLIDGSGHDIWGSQDGFRYAYQILEGDATIVARVASMNGPDPWTKAGVMIRSSAASDAAHASMFVSLTKGLAFQRRQAQGAASVHTAVPGAGAPWWVRLDRTGHTFTASVSTDGTSWSVVGTDSIPMPTAVLVGLAVTSHDDAAVATATFDRVTITAPLTLPSSWRSDDIGLTGVAGSASEAGGRFTVRGAGADVWGTTDALHLAWQPLDGDGSIVAHVGEVDGAHPWMKAGVMMRASLDPGSAHAFMLVSAGNGLAFQRRTAGGGQTGHTAAPSASMRWVKLVRHGTTITAAASHDGISWTTVGSDVFALGQRLHVGLAVTSHDATRLATATFDQVTVSPGS